MKTPHTTRGFTLIEMLVATALFVTVMVVAVGSLLVILDANRKAQNISTSINNVFFSMEMMTRLIRTGFDYDCGGATTPSLDCPNGRRIIEFTDDQGRENTIEFNRVEGAIYRRYDGNNFKITSDDFNVDEVRFIVTGAERDDTEQPTVTIVMRGVVSPESPEKSELIVQSTVTQRLLDL